MLSGGVQAEKELSEVNLQLQSLHERLEEADGLSSAQVDTLQCILLSGFYLFNQIIIVLQQPLTVNHYSLYNSEAQAVWFPRGIK